VTNQSSGTVSVIATATNTVVTTMAVGRTPTGVAITPDGTRAYVTNQDSATVSVIDTSINTVVASVPVGSGPVGVAVTPDGMHVYVTNFREATVSVIATATDSVVATVSVGSGPVAVAITPAPVTSACPLGQGFWKKQTGLWPVTSLNLGGLTYSQTELLAILEAPVRGNASLILARQLIAAKLNTANGSVGVPISSTVAHADNLLSQFAVKLPHNVRTSSAIGKQMVNDATVLDRYNNGSLTPDCQP